MAAKSPHAKSLLQRAVYWLTVIVLWVGIGSVALLAWYAYDLPDTDELDRARPTSGITFLGSSGEIIATRGDIVGAPVKLRQVPDYLVQAVIATEDRRFYEHFGLDPLGLMRAMWVNLQARRVVQGGSTITQQLAKNIFLTPERSLRRKAQEMLLALWLEQEYSKDEILALYLNRVYFGSGTYGITAASRKYFGKQVGQLELPEAAMLAGLLKAPSRYAPTRDLSLARGRASQVLANMVDAGYLTDDQSAAARAKPVSIRRAGGTQGVQYFVDWVVDQLPDYIGRPQGDLIVATTFEPRLQKFAEQVMHSAIERNARPLRAGQGALISLGPAGEVRAMVGGHSYARSQFNRATQARRQPGSAFKPFVYLTALEQGMTPDSVMRDSEIIFGDWRPRNFSGGFRGEVTLHEALRDSINTVAVKVSEKAGRHRVVQTAHRMGILSDLSATPAVALGASEVGLLELTAAYVPFANGGYGAIPYAIREVRTPSGKVLFRRSGSGTGRVASARDVGLMNRMLADVLIVGTGKAARLGKRPAAGKTGTSQDFRDAWFVGYTPELVTGVWFGNDDATPMKQVTGGGLPAKTWKRYMELALQPASPKPLPGSDRETEPSLGDLVSRVWRALGGDSD